MAPRILLASIATAALSLSLITTAHAATITVSIGISSAPITTGGDFSGHTGYSGYPGIYAQPHFSAAEAFAGQTVTTVAGFEEVSGTPTGGLQTPDDADGVTLWSNELQGNMGACGDPCTGEGAVSFSFPTPLAEMGLDIRLIDGGTVTLQFFEPNGTSFDPVTVTGFGALSRIFKPEAGHTIGGVTMTNADTYGVAYDDLRIMETVVPVEPSTWGAVKALYR